MSATNGRFDRWSDFVLNVVIPVMLAFTLGRVLAIEAKVNEIHEAGCGRPVSAGPWEEPS